MLPSVYIFYSIAGPFLIPAAILTIYGGSFITSSKIMNTVSISCSSICSGSSKV